MAGNAGKVASLKQEQHIAKVMGGKVQPNSGGTRFGGGDVLTGMFFFEAKTNATPQSSFTIKKEWIKKAFEQAFEQGKPFYAIAIRFEPDGKDYYLIDEAKMKMLKHYLEEVDE